MMEKENNDDVSVTTTTTTVAETIVEETELNIRAAVFLIFAEYLGYESPLIEWAEKWCNGENIPKFQKGIIEIDALAIFDKVKEDYTEAEIKKWYTEYYPVILADYDTNLLAMELADKEKSDLPF